jgi:hypothetical protein
MHGTKRPTKKWKKEADQTKAEGLAEAGHEDSLPEEMFYCFRARA